MTAKLFADAIVLLSVGYVWALGVVVVLYCVAWLVDWLAF